MNEKRKEPIGLYLTKARKIRDDLMMSEEFQKTQYARRLILGLWATFIFLSVPLVFLIEIYSEMNVSFVVPVIIVASFVIALLISEKKIKDRFPPDK